MALRIGLIFLFCAAGTVVAGQTPTPDPSRPVAVFVFDLAANGYALVGPSAGVSFDMSGSGRPTRIGWTAAGADDGFLVLDTNGNGRIDTGREMVGNGWRMSNGVRVPSGDRALMVIQGIERWAPGPGPYSTAVINRDDEVYARLRIWRDGNHNGRSEPDELAALPDLKITEILLGFRNLKRTVHESGNVLLIEGSFRVNERGVDVIHRMVEVEFAGQQ